MKGLLAHIGGTPLVPLTRISGHLPQPVLAKCEHLNPGGSVKDRIAKAIVDDAEARGLLVPLRTPPMTIIEATAGNTGVGLALVAAARGYALVCVMPEKMCVDKRIALQALGAEVVITANAPISSPENFQRVARRMAEEGRGFLADQFANPANVRVHEETTGAEILAQTGGRVGAFGAGAGTGGTISGVGRRLKAENPKVRIVLADPVGSAIADWVELGRLGPDGSYAVEGIGAGQPPVNLHREVIDGAERVSDEESFSMVRRLVREEGLLVGGSAGTNVVAALRVAERGDVDGPVVTSSPTSGTATAPSPGCRRSSSDRPWDLIRCGSVGIPCPISSRFVSSSGSSTIRAASSCPTHGTVGAPWPSPSWASRPWRAAARVSPSAAASPTTCGRSRGTRYSSTCGTSSPPPPFRSTPTSRTATPPIPTAWPPT